MTTFDKVTIRDRKEIVSFLKKNSEINEEDKLIAAEKEAGLIPPTEQEMQMAQMAMDAQSQNLGKPVNEPEVDESSIEAPESPKGGEI